VAHVVPIASVLALLALPVSEVAASAAAVAAAFAAYRTAGTAALGTPTTEMPTTAASLPRLDGEVLRCAIGNEGRCEGRRHEGVRGNQRGQKTRGGGGGVGTENRRVDDGEGLRGGGEGADLRGSSRRIGHGRWRGCRRNTDNEGGGTRRRREA